jgi:hypothetical protein
MDKPTAWYDPSNGVVSTDRDCPLFTPLGQVWPLFPKSEWVELTDEEIKAVWKKLDYDMSHGKFATCGTHYVIVEFARAMFAKSKEKNT